MISDKGHFGNLEQFDNVDKNLPASPLEVAMVASQEHVHHLPGYDLQRLDNAPAYWYYSAFALGGDFEPTFTKNHWMIDSGCTDHLTPFLDDFAHLSKEVCYTSVANRERVHMYGPGKVIVQQ